MRFGIKSERHERPKLSQRVRLRQSSSTYRVPSESEDSSEDEFEDGVVDGGHSDSDLGSEDSFCYASESEVPAAMKRHSRPSKTMEEQRELTEAMASIRLHVGYSDPLEEWKKRNKQAAFDAAQARMRRKQADMLSLYLTAAKITEANTEKTLREQQAIVEQNIRAHEQRQYEEDQQNLKRWETRNKMLWEQVDKAAASVEAKLEAQRQREREAERRAAEAEAQRIQAEKERKEKAERIEREKKEKAEAEKRRVQEEKQRADQEEHERKEKEEHERRAAEEKQRQEAAQLSRFDKERKNAGITMPTEDWQAAIATDQGIKIGQLRRAKEDSVQRRQWTAVRRSVTLRVGQLTDSEEEIVRISNQIFDTIRAFDPQSDLYPAALSALAKAIILQAETEVTAKLDTAGPLASVVINLFNLPGFDEVLWSKMVVRSGGWLIGHCVNRPENQSLPQIKRQSQDRDKEERLFKKLAGFREDENQVERQTRIGGIVSLYFAICTSPKAAASGPLPLPFWPTKIWTFLARIMSDPRLLRQSMAPYVMHSCLEVAAPTGAAMFGKQWIKLLMAMGQASMEDGKVGASDDAGKTARVRLQLKAEKLLEDLGALPGRS